MRFTRFIPTGVGNSAYSAVQLSVAGDGGMPATIWNVRLRVGLAEFLAIVLFCLVRRIFCLGQPARHHPRRTLPQGAGPCVGRIAWDRGPPFQ